MLRGGILLNLFVNEVVSQGEPRWKNWTRDQFMKQTMLPGLPTGEGAPPRGYLVILAMLIIVLVVAAWMRMEGDAGLENIEVIHPGADDSGEMVVQTDWPAWNPATETWGAVEDESPAAQAKIPTEALGVACNKVESFSWNNLAYSGAFKRLDMAGVFADSPGRRGEVFELIGDLMDLHRVDVFDRYGFKIGDRTETWAGTIRPWKSNCGSENPVHFLLVDKPDDALSATELKLGDPVKLQGVFFKLQQFEVAGEDVMGPWFLGKRLFKNFSLPQVDSIDRSLIGTGVDDVSRKKGLEPFFQEGLFHLMVAAYNHEAFLLEDVQPIEGVAIRELLSKPDNFRGKTIAVDGRVIRIEEHKMKAFFAENREGDHDFDRFWITYITTDGKVPLAVMMLHPPPADLLPADRVTFEATFFRVWGFRSERGWNVSPLMVAAGDLIVVAPPKEEADLVGYSIVALALLLTLVLILVLYKDRRRSDLQTRSLRASRRLREGRIDLNKLSEAENDPEATA